MRHATNLRRAATAAALSFPFVLAGCGDSSGSGARPADDGAGRPPPVWNESGPWAVAALTFVGSPADDQLREALPEADGSVWIAGQAGGPGLPTTPGAFQPRYAGEDTSRRPVSGDYGGDVWLGRLAADGTSFLAATYFGGARTERNAYGIERTQDGDVVIATMTRSTDLPTTPGVVQPKFAGGNADWCVARLSSDLKSLRWCTYLGGSGTEFPRAGLALDAQDRPTVAGYAEAADFPAAAGAPLRAARGKNDVVVLRLSADGRRVEASARVGGARGDEVAGTVLGADGAVYFGGQTESDDFPATKDAPQRARGGAYDATLARLSPDLQAVGAATFLGGAGNEFAEHRLVRAPNGDVLLTGSTGSADFPTTKGALQTRFGGENDGFAARYSSDLSRVVWATFVGGGGDDNLLSPVVAPDGTVWCVGFTTDATFPTTPDALQPAYGGGPSDGVVVALSADGARLVYASFFGGAGRDALRALSFAPDGALWLVGTSSSKNLPATAGAPQARIAGGTDGVVVKLRRRG